MLCLVIVWNELIWLIYFGGYWKKNKACVRNDGEQTAKNKKIKPQETRGFNVENPPNAEGKNHGRQPANLHYIGVSVYNASGDLQEE